MCNDKQTGICIETINRSLHDGTMWAAIAGTLVVMFMDLANPFAGSVCRQYAYRLFENLELIHMSGFLKIATFAVFISFIGAITSWVESPRTRSDAFARGMSVMALMSLGPKDSIDQQLTEATSSFKHEILQSYNQQPRYSSVFSAGLIFPGVPIESSVKSKLSKPQETKFRPNASIEQNNWISESKPSYSLFSLFTNEIEIHKVGYSFNKGDSIEVIRGTEFETPLRKYRYVQVRYLSKDGEVMSGWIYAGRGSWQNIKFHSE
ncbi:MAG: hypothetical protein K9J17_08545 [Flavobacteriales bacterium]|nr:hypothetical protein [Flavobacteriales bacterium]